MVSAILGVPLVFNGEVRVLAVAAVLPLWPGPKRSTMQLTTARAGVLAPLRCVVF